MPRDADKDLDVSPFKASFPPPPSSPRLTSTSSSSDNIIGPTFNLDIPSKDKSNRFFPLENSFGPVLCLRSEDDDVISKRNADYHFPNPCDQPTSPKLESIRIGTVRRRKRRSMLQRVLDFEFIDPPSPMQRLPDPTGEGNIFSDDGDDKFGINNVLDPIYNDGNCIASVASSSTFPFSFSSLSTAPPLVPSPPARCVRACSLRNFAAPVRCLDPTATVAVRQPSPVIPSQHQTHEYRQSPPSTVFGSNPRLTHLDQQKAQRKPQQNPKQNPKLNSLPPSPLVSLTYPNDSHIPTQVHSSRSRRNSNPILIQPPFKTGLQAYRLDPPCENGSISHHKSHHLEPRRHHLQLGHGEGRKGEGEGEGICEGRRGGGGKEKINQDRTEKEIEERMEDEEEKDNCKEEEKTEVEDKVEMKVEQVHESTNTNVEKDEEDNEKDRQGHKDGNEATDMQFNDDYISSSLSIKKNSTALVPYTPSPAGNPFSFSSFASFPSPLQPIYLPVPLLLHPLSERKKETVANEMEEELFGETPKGMSSSSVRSLQISKAGKRWTITCMAKCLAYIMVIVGLFHLFFSAYFNSVRQNSDYFNQSYGFIQKDVAAAEHVDYDISRINVFETPSFSYIFTNPTSHSGVVHRTKIMKKNISMHYARREKNKSFTVMTSEILNTSAAAPSPSTPFCQLKCDEKAIRGIRNSGLEITDILLRGSSTAEAIEISGDESENYTWRMLQHQRIQETQDQEGKYAVSKKGTNLNKDLFINMNSSIACTHTSMTNNFNRGRHTNLFSSCNKLSYDEFLIDIKRIPINSALAMKKNNPDPMIHYVDPKHLEIMSSSSSSPIIHNNCSVTFIQSFLSAGLQGASLIIPPNSSIQLRVNPKQNKKAYTFNYNSFLEHFSPRSLTVVFSKVILLTIGIKAGVIFHFTLYGYITRRNSSNADQVPNSEGVREDGWVNTREDPCKDALNTNHFLAGEDNLAMDDSLKMLQLSEYEYFWTGNGSNTSTREHLLFQSEIKEENKAANTSEAMKKLRMKGWIRCRKMATIQNM